MLWFSQETKVARQAADVKSSSLNEQMSLCSRERAAACYEEMDLRFREYTLGKSDLDARVRRESIYRNAAYATFFLALAINWMAWRDWRGRHDDAA
jgi:hypothetical protein